MPLTLELEVGSCGDVVEFRFNVKFVCEPRQEVTFRWPGTAMVYGESELNDAQREHVKSAINGFSQKLESMMAAEGLPLHVSPLWRPFNLFIAWDP